MLTWLTSQPELCKSMFGRVELATRGQIVLEFVAVPITELIKLP
jgi:hypothetical protein